MAEFGLPSEPEPLIPEITQETLAEMIGTTRSRVSFFMNRFRKLGLIEYNGRIRVQCRHVAFGGADSALARRSQHCMLSI